MVFSVLLENNTRRVKRGVNYLSSNTPKQLINSLTPRPFYLTIGSLPI